MARFIKRTPAREVLTGQMLSNERRLKRRPHRIGGQLSLVTGHSSAKQCNGGAAVGYTRVADAIGISITRWPRNHESVCGLTPSLLSGQMYSDRFHCSF